MLVQPVTTESVPAPACEAGKLGSGADPVLASQATRHAGRRASRPSPADGAHAFDADALVDWLVAMLRAHPHVGNVMTHISGAHWERVGQALGAILDPATTREALSPLARNIVELMWNEGGATGRIFKPWLRELVGRCLPPPVADSVLGHIALLAQPQAGDRSGKARIAETAGIHVGDERVLNARKARAFADYADVVELLKQPGEAVSLQIVADHDPLPLHLQLEGTHRSRCEWTDLERGPDVWRICLRRRSRPEAP